MWLLLSCTRPGPPPAHGPVDADGDGAAFPADCDDLDPLVHPDAPELCDGQDDDCDGQVGLSSHRKRAEPDQRDPGRRAAAR